MSFRPLGADIQALLQEWLQNPDARRVVLQRTWARTVGERVSRRCRVLDFEQGVLTIEVTDSSWAPQLERMSAELIGKVNGALGDACVRRIAWVQEGPKDSSGAAPRSP